MKVGNIKRRDFVKIFGLTSGGLILGCNFSEDKTSIINTLVDGDSFVPNLFIQLQKDGKLTIVVSRSEMGQGIRTSMASAIADEMEADWDMVSVQQATGDAKFGDQNTDGSRSIRTLLNPMRKMGAMARLILEKAAAQTWSVDLDECRSENHYVIHTSGKKLPFGALVDTARNIKIPADEEILLKDKKDFRYIGKRQKNIDLDNFIHGTATFGLDARLPKMKYAAIARCPSAFGTVKSYDDSDTKEIYGVEQVIQLDPLKASLGEQFFGMLGGVAVVANNTWSAFQGKSMLNVEWDSGVNGDYDTAEFKKTLVKRVQKQGKVTPGTTGNVASAFSKADKIVEATYTMPHLVHAPMEVPNALAWVHDGKVEVWAPVQAPQGVRAEISKFFEVPLEKVIVNVTLLGGAFGRKSKCDFVIEAVALSKKINAPVQVVWTREDDIQHSYYHAQSAQHIKASFDNYGKVTGWLHRTAFPSILSTFKPFSNYAAGFELGQGFTNLPYDIPNFQIENAKAEAHVRIGWMRSVYNIISGFGVNSFVDELAIASGKDGVDFRMELIGADRVEKSSSPHHYDSSRMKNVLQEVKKMSNFGQPLIDGHGMGIAIHYSFYSYTATAVEVSVKNNKVKVENVYVAFDCGLYVNKDAVLNQLEGSVIFGMSIAMFGKVEVKEGAVEQSNFHDYQLTRMKHAPKIHVKLIGNNHDPTGVGEPGVPPVAPAICNAIFDATGIRVRDLPLVDHGMV